MEETRWPISFDNFNSSIGRSTIQHDLVQRSKTKTKSSSVLFESSELVWSNVIFSGESNCEVLHRKNRISICRFRNDRTRVDKGLCCVTLDDHCSSFIDLLTQSSAFRLDKLIHLHNDRKFSLKLPMHIRMYRPGLKTISKENVLIKPGKQCRYEYD